MHHCSTCRRKIFGTCSPGFEDGIPVYCRFCQEETTNTSKVPNGANIAPKEQDIQMFEDTLDLSDTENPYSINRPVFTSAEDTFNFLYGFNSERVHTFNFNGEQTSFRLEKRMEIQTNGIRVFECVPGKQGSFDSREYYGYDSMVGYMSRQTRRGYICPSIVVRVDSDGIHKDTGIRMLCFLRTRCNRPRYDAIAYSLVTEKVEKIAKVFSNHLSGNLYTAWHKPFDYNNVIKK